MLSRITIFNRKLNQDEVANQKNELATCDKVNRLLTQLLGLSVDFKKLFSVAAINKNQELDIEPESIEDDTDFIFLLNALNDMPLIKKNDGVLYDALINFSVLISFQKNNGQDLETLKIKWPEWLEILIWYAICWFSIVNGLIGALTSYQSLKPKEDATVSPEDISYIMLILGPLLALGGFILAYARAAKGREKNHTDYIVANISTFLFEKYEGKQHHSMISLAAEAEEAAGFSAGNKLNVKNNDSLFVAIGIINEFIANTKTIECKGQTDRVERIAVANIRKSENKIKNLFRDISYVYDLPADDNIKGLIDNFIGDPTGIHDAGNPLSKGKISPPTTCMSQEQLLSEASPLLAENNKFDTVISIKKPRPIKKLLRRIGEQANQSLVGIGFQAFPAGLATFFGIIGAINQYIIALYLKIRPEELQKGKYGIAELCTAVSYALIAAGFKVYSARREKLRSDIIQHMQHELTTVNRVHKLNSDITKELELMKSNLTIVSTVRNSIFYIPSKSSAKSNEKSEQCIAGNLITFS